MEVLPLSGPLCKKPITVKKKVLVEGSKKQRGSLKALGSQKLAKLTSLFPSNGAPGNGPLFTDVSRSAEFTAWKTTFVPGTPGSKPTHKPWSGGVTSPTPVPPLTAVWSTSLM